MSKPTVKLCRLSHLGITSIEQVALHLPISVQDNTRVITVFDTREIIPNQEVVISGILFDEPKTSWSKSRPVSKFVVTDGNRRCQFTLFGDVREITKTYVKNKPINVRGMTSFYNNKLCLNNAEIIESHEVGCVAATYKGQSGLITPKTASKLIKAHIPASIPMAADKIAELIKNNVEDDVMVAKIFGFQLASLENILTEAHQPTSIMQWHQSMKSLRIIAAFLAGQALLEYRTDRYAAPFLSASYAQLTKHIPFELTGEQKSVLGQMVNKIRQSQLHGLLLADVGTGKTIVFGLLTAYFAWANKRVALLLPNSSLARQIHQELISYFPWMQPKLVLGSSTDQYFDECVLIGTTALLFREVGHFDLVVCDEQQKLSIQQREQLRSESTHYLEVSATPIPRTLCLALYGCIDIYQLTKCHVEKTIHTRIWERDESRLLFNEIMNTVACGKKVLVVCPKREIDREKKSELMSVEQIAQKMESYCPGLVSMSHSGLSDEENTRAIESIKSGKSLIHVSTTKVEIGLTVPLLERIVIYQPNRMALTQIHQIRGRAVRQGGEGYCDLYLPKPLKSKASYERLQVLVNETDGFAIAEKDMQIRGIGDISRSGQEQHGSSDILIKNVVVTLKQIEWIVSRVNQYLAWKESKRSA